MSKVRAPFRYDIVGSFLRKEEVKQAREQYASGNLSADALKKVEEESICSLVEKEKAVGL